MNTLDIIIIAVLFLFACIGMAQGLIKTVYRLMSFFIAIILAFILYPYMADFIRESIVFEWLVETIHNNLNIDYMVGDALTQDRNAALYNLPLPAFLIDLLVTHDTNSNWVSMGVNNIGAFVSVFLAGLVVNIISMLLVFVLVKIVLALIGYLLDIVSRLPVIRTLNRIGGFVAGFAIGVVICWIVLVVISVFTTTSMYETVRGLLEDSWFIAHFGQYLIGHFANV